MKYAGADWLPKDIKISELGRKVADVLGQVFQGIYHLEEVRGGGKEICWNSNSSISVPLYGSFATYDDPKLTVLLLCCVASKIAVNIAPRHENKVRLEFTPGCPIPGIFQVNTNGKKYSNVFTMANDFMIDAGGSVDRLADGFMGRGQAIGTCNPIPIYWLSRLVNSAHESCCRVEVSGRSHKKLHIRITGRDPGGTTMYTRHPGIEYPRLYRDYWEPLLEEESVNA